MSKINYRLVFVYFISLLFMYPVFAHILMYRFGYFVDKLPHGKFWIFIQIFLSGPALLAIGFILYFKYREIKINKFIGIAYLLVGIYWLYILIGDIIKEAA